MIVRINNAIFLIIFAFTGLHSDFHPRSSFWGEAYTPPGSPDKRILDVLVVVMLRDHNLRDAEGTQVQYMDQQRGKAQHQPERPNVEDSSRRRRRV